MTNDLGIITKSREDPTKYMISVFRGFIWMLVSFMFFIIIYVYDLEFNSEYAKILFIISIPVFVVFYLRGLSSVLDTNNDEIRLLGFSSLLIMTCTYVLYSFYGSLGIFMFGRIAGITLFFWFVDEWESKVYDEHPYMSRNSQNLFKYYILLVIIMVDLVLVYSGELSNAFKFLSLFLPYIIATLTSVNISVEVETRGSGIYRRAISLLSSNLKKVQLTNSQWMYFLLLALSVTMIIITDHLVVILFIIMAYVQEIYFRVGPIIKDKVTPDSIVGVLDYIYSRYNGTEQLWHFTYVIGKYNQKIDKIMMLSILKYINYDWIEETLEFYTPYTDPNIVRLLKNEDKFDYSRFIDDMERISIIWDEVDEINHKLSPIAIVKLLQNQNLSNEDIRRLEDEKCLMISIITSLKSDKEIVICCSQNNLLKSDSEYERLKEAYQLLNKDIKVQDIKGYLN